ncbi:UNVERIFIED_CONTAM: dUTP pyrophosphatase, partial [Kocuria sp. CPCC 205274]
MATKKLKLGIKLLNQDARLPKRSNPSDAGIDIFSSESIVIQSGATHTIHTGVALNIPDGYFVRLVGTSGNNAKT